jgi:lipid-A-disaccharide synthase
MMGPRIMILAGEASGDTLASELVRALRQEAHAKPWMGVPRFYGAGGPRMAAAGVELALDLAAHAVVGLWDVLKNFRKFKSFFEQLLDLALRTQPHLIILVDNPGFNLRFVRTLQAWLRRRRGPFQNWRPRLVYYVSPQLWAWHESRVYQIARDVDLMLCLFPFEKDWYAARVPKLQVEFVGHPLLERFGTEASCGQALPEPREDPVVVLLPGSRVRELKQHLPIMMEAARLIAQSFPARFLLVLPNPALVEMAQPMIPSGLKLQVQQGRLEAALRQATLALAASGTVTMECAFFGVPTIVMYRVPWPTYWAGRLLIKVNYLAMPNLLANEMIFPEFIQQGAQASALAAAAVTWLQKPDLRLQVREKLARVIRSLGGPGANGRAAKAICRLLT